MPSSGVNWTNSQCSLVLDGTQSSHMNPGTTHCRHSNSFTSAYRKEGSSPVTLNAVGIGSGVLIPQHICLGRSRNAHGSRASQVTSRLRTSTPHMIPELPLAITLTHNILEQNKSTKISDRLFRLYQKYPLSDSRQDAAYYGGVGYEFVICVISYTVQAGDSDSLPLTIREVRDVFRAR